MGRPDRGHGRDGGDSDTPWNADDTDPLDYDSVVQLAKRATAATMHLKAMTYSPKSDRVCDIERRPRALALFGELVGGWSGMDPNLPIYLVAIACHTNTEMDWVMKEAYIYASQRVNQPLIGVWTSHEGDRFLDAVIPVQFPEILKGQAGTGRKYDQAYIIKLNPDGTCRSVQTH